MYFQYTCHKYLTPPSFLPKMTRAAYATAFVDTIEMEMRSSSREEEVWAGGG